MAHLHFHDISFSYGAETVVEHFTRSFHPGWTGIIGANGAGKTTVLKIAAGILEPGGGTVSGPGRRIYLPQEPVTDLEDLEDFFHDWEAPALELKAELGIEFEWLFRLGTLSYGELKRLQVAWALWKKPEILLADEPTNHLDGHTAGIIADSLFFYAGIGILVSHDRNLLDRLCGRCLFLEAGRIDDYGGGYTVSTAERETRRKSHEKEREDVRRKLKALRKTAAGHRDLAGRADDLRSKRHLARSDHDGREKLNRARISGKDAVHGKILNRMQGRIEHLESAVEGMSVQKEKSLFFTFTGHRSPGSPIVYLSADAIVMDHENNRMLSHPVIDIRTGDRIMLTGANGSGKSTLVRRLFEKTDRKSCLYIPQELSGADRISIERRLSGLNHSERGFLGSVIDRLGSSAERILLTPSHSPGEARKLLFALGLLTEPEIIILDEPMNHLDLPSVECFQKALRSVPCALLLVTHDRTFIEAWEGIHWHIEEGVVCIR